MRLYESIRQLWTISSRFANSVFSCFRLLMIFVLVLVWPVTVVQAESRQQQTANPHGLKMIPAQLGLARDSLIAKIACPAKPEVTDQVILFCHTEISRKGRARMRRSFCYSHEQAFIRHVRAAAKAIYHARFIPAMIEGKPVPVNFNFRLIFDYRNGCRVLGVPNYGLQTESLSQNYYLPQERVDTHDWFSRSPRARRAMLWMLRENLIFHFSAQVNTDGTAADARMDYGTFRSEATTREVLQALEASRFIPGLVDGVPRTMRYHDFYRSWHHH